MSSSFASNHIDDDDDYKSSAVDKRTAAIGNNHKSFPKLSSHTTFLKPVAPNVEQHLSLGKSLNIPDVNNHREKHQAQFRHAQQDLYSDMRFNSTTYIQDLSRQIEQIWKDNEYKPYHCTPFKRLLRAPIMQYALENNLLPDRIQKRLDKDIKSQRIRNLINYLSSGKNCSNSPQDIKFTEEQLEQLYDYEGSSSSDDDNDEDGDNNQRKSTHEKTNNRSIHLNESSRFSVLAEKSAPASQPRKSWSSIVATNPSSLSNHTPNPPTSTTTASANVKRKPTVFHAHHVDSASLLPETAIDHFNERQLGREQRDRILEAQKAEIEFKQRMEKEQSRHVSQKSDLSSSFPSTKNTNDSLKSQKDKDMKQVHTSASKTTTAPTAAKTTSKTPSVNKSKNSDWLVLNETAGGVSFGLKNSSHLSKSAIKQRQEECKENLQHHQDQFHSHDNHNKADDQISDRERLVSFVYFQHDLVHALMKLTNQQDEKGKDVNINTKSTTASKKMDNDKLWCTANDLKYIAPLLHKNKEHYLFAMRLKHQQKEYDKDRQVDDHKHAEDDDYDDDYEYVELNSVIAEYYYNQKRIHEIVSDLVPHLPVDDHSPAQSLDKSKKSSSKIKDDHALPKQRPQLDDFYTYAELLEKFPTIQDHEPHHIIHDDETPVQFYNPLCKDRYDNQSELGLCDSNADDHRRVDNEQFHNDDDQFHDDENDNRGEPVFDLDAQPFIPTHPVPQHQQQMQQQQQQPQQPQQPYHYQRQQQYQPSTRRYNHSRHYQQPNYNYYPQHSHYKYPPQPQPYCPPQQYQQQHWNYSQQQPRHRGYHDVPSFHPHNRDMNQNQANQIRNIYHHDTPHPPHPPHSQHPQPPPHPSQTHPPHPPQHSQPTPEGDVILLSVEEYHRLLQLSKPSSRELIPENNQPPQQPATTEATAQIAPTTPVQTHPDVSSSQHHPQHFPQQPSQYRNYDHSHDEDYHYNREYSQSSAYNANRRRNSTDNQYHYQPQPMQNTGEYTPSPEHTSRYSMYRVPQPPYPPHQHYNSHQMPPPPIMGYHSHPMMVMNRPTSGVSTTSSIASIGVDGLTRKQRRKLWYRNYLDKHPDERQRFLQDHYFKKQQHPSQLHRQGDNTNDPTATTNDDNIRPQRRASLCSIDNDNYYEDNEDFCIY